MRRVRVPDGTEGLSVEQTAEWYIRRWEKRTGRSWPQAGRRRVDLPGDAGSEVLRCG